MKILITGSSGLIGRALKVSLESHGNQICTLRRKQSETGPDAAYWDPEKGEIDLESLGKIDAVVHLAGESVADGRWTDDKKKRIRDSRVKGTALLCGALAKLNDAPRLLISGSAIGIYGSRGNELLTEDSKPGHDFLATVCAEWESATESARSAGIRVVLIRIGVVLSKEGGALSKMVTPFKLGVGGKVGSGDQFMSWIALDDIVGSITFLLESEQATGPFNLVAQNPVTNAEFASTLGKVLSRPAVLPAPAFALRLAFGEMADALLLSSIRVEPRRLTSLGFQFKYANLDDALRHELQV